MTEYVCMVDNDGYGYLKDVIVRCCDCKRMSLEPDPPNVGPAIGYETYINWCGRNNREVEPDGFCKWGEKREND